jgi:uncharacterized protein YkwD
MTRAFVAMASIVSLLTTSDGSLRAQSTAELRAAEKAVHGWVNEARFGGDLPIERDSSPSYLPPLAIDSRLQTAAREWAVHMAEDPDQNFNHNRFEERFQPSGFDGGYRAENISMKPILNPNVIVSSWMGSTGHRANILNAIYTHWE